MRTRIGALGAALVLLLAGATTLATGVLGEDYERQASVPHDGTAYRVEWESDEPGMLRLSLDPDTAATSPQASLSLYQATGTAMGTYTLDEAWPRLDQRLQPGTAYLLVIHRSYQSEVDILAQEGHPMDLNPVPLTSETVPLAQGTHEPVKRQIGLWIDEEPVHMSLRFEGNATGLDIAAYNQDNEPVLDAQANHVNTSQGQRLVATLNPQALHQGRLLVQVQATELTGTLALETTYLDQDPKHVVQAENDTSTRNQTTHSTQQTQPPENQTTTTPTNQTPSHTNASTTTTNTSTNTTNATYIERVAPLPTNQPIALSLNNATQPLYATPNPGASQLILFDPEDQIHARLDLDPATAHHEPTNATHNVSVIPLPIDTTGEYVLILQGAHQSSTLYTDANASQIHHRALDTKRIQQRLDQGAVEASSTDRHIHPLDTGLLGFAWELDGTSAEQSIRLFSPRGALLFEDCRTTMTGLTLSNCHHEANPLIGSAGDYVIETETTASALSSIEYTITTYER